MRPGLGAEIVLGQAQGAFAMGVGYVLLETLPLYEDGPGNGEWNLGQYLSREARTCRSIASRSRSCRPSTQMNGRRGLQKS